MARSASSPRILYITRVWPARATTGGEMRSRHILRALQTAGTVEVLVLDEEKRGEEMRMAATGEDAVAERLAVKAFGENRSALQKAMWSVDPAFSYPHGFGVDENTCRHVVERSKEFDLVWFWTLRAADMFPRFSWERSVVDIDDVPSTLEQSRLHVAGTGMKRLLAYRRMLTWRRREKVLDRRFSTFAVCSEADRQYIRALGLRAPVHVISNGWDLPAAEPKRSPALPPRIGFLGAFGHEPNREGIEWFVQECWDRVRAAIPEARLRLVGAGSDGAASPKGPGIDGLGWVDDTSEEIASWSVAIVPIRVGAGSRVKIAQLISHKCPLVATRFGAQGYEAAHGDGLQIADSAHEFAAACVSAVRDPAAADASAQRAWEHHARNWTWDAIRPAVWAAMEDCLRRANEGEPAFATR